MPLQGAQIIWDALVRRPREMTDPCFGYPGPGVDIPSRRMNAIGSGLRSRHILVRPTKQGRTHMCDGYALSELEILFGVREFAERPGPGAKTNMVTGLATAR